MNAFICWRFSNVFIAALIRRLASVIMPLLTSYLNDILLFLLVNERTGTDDCPFFGNILKLLDVSVSLRVVPSASLNVSFPAPTVPLNGWILRVPPAFISLSVEFFAETLKFSALSDMASVYLISALAISPVIPTRCMILDESLRETLCSGPSLIFIPSSTALMVSLGIFTTILSPLISPVREDDEKLYMSSCESLAPPFIIALMLPVASIPRLSGRNEFSSPSSARNVPSMVRSGSLPRRSFAPAAADNLMPGRSAFIRLILTSSLPSLFTSASAVKPIFSVRPGKS